jgi:hypothetical protein
MRPGRITVVGGAIGAAALAGLFSCFADPREDDAPTVADRCDVAMLGTDPKAPETSLRAYVESTDRLLAQATSVEAALRDVCNAIDTDLGTPNGPTVQTACNPIIQRIQGIVKNEPAAPPGALAANHFVDISFPQTCATAPGTTEACLAKCSGPCDPSACPPEKLAGLCNGECEGSCTERGDAIPCIGKCVGETNLDAGSCAGECVGRCAAPAWTGSCTAACNAGFSGFCAGTCTGKCNGSPVGNVAPPPDAGGVDAGADADAGVPTTPPATPQRPPTGADGNCPGKCEGVCSSGANGNCGGQCLTFTDAGPPFGNFGAGFCGGGQVPAGCSGMCRVGGVGGNGSVDTCNGACTQLNKTSCAGVCRVVNGKGCKGTLSNTICEGTLSCGQNAECANACQATARLASSCTEPKSAQIILVTDTLLHDALVKHQGPLGKAVNELSQLREALGFIGNRSFGDFATLGLSNDLARACVTQGRGNVEKAQVLVNNAVAANPTIAQKAQ